jgi:hypothetical protein
MAITSSNRNKPWSAAEDKQLRQLVRENTPTRVISFKLGRTQEAVYSHAQRGGISLKPVNQSPYRRRK